MHTNIHVHAHTCAETKLYVNSLTHTCTHYFDAQLHIREIWTLRCWHNFPFNQNSCKVKDQWHHWLQGHQPCLPSCIAPSSPQLYSPLSAVGVLIGRLARSTRWGVLICVLARPMRWERWGTAMSDSNKSIHPGLLAVRFPTSTLGDF